MKGPPTPRAGKPRRHASVAGRGVRALTSLAGLLPASWLRSVARAQWRHPFLKAAFDRGVTLFQGHDGVIRGGAGKGLRFNVGSSNVGYLFGTTEPALQRAILESVRPGWVVFDIGANVGFFTVIAARLTGPSGRVIGFEPLSDNAARIRHNARLNGFDHVEVRTDAVGARDGTTPFFLSSNPNWGRIADRGRPSGTVAEIAVPIRSLDGLSREGAIPDPDLIKIDVEGAEEAVLQGAAALLRRARPVLLIELHGTNDPIGRLLGSLGYESRVLRGGTALSSARWDAQILAVPRP